MPPTRRTPQASKVITPDGAPVSLFSLRQHKREATGEPFVFDVDGEVFTLKSPEDADWQVTADLEAGEGDLRKFLANLLGDDYERFRKLDGISAADIRALIEASVTHYQGVTRGE